MVDPGMLSSTTDEWSTPKRLFMELDREFQFTLDVCATADNTKCKEWFSKFTDGLIQPWRGTCWMNPPYGKEISKWMRKALTTANLGQATVVCLVPSRTDTAWWHDYAMMGEIRFLRGRVRFGGCKSNAPFPSAIVVFRRITS
jgi:phage N-6-adenine-methyltransferase